MTNFNERTNTLLYKNIPLTLYSRKGDFSCVREVSWRRGQTATYWPKVLLTIAALRAQAVCLELVLTPLASYIQLTQAVCVLVIFLFDAHRLRLLTQVNLLIDSSVEGQYITDSNSWSYLTLGNKNISVR